MNNGQPQPKIERNADYKSKLQKLKNEKFELFSFDAPDQLQSKWKDLIDKAIKN
jgi:hypothetical protein